MKNIKDFNKFNESSSYDEVLILNKVNEIINNPKFNRYVNTIPSYFKSKIINFLSSGEVLDMDKIISINNKYNIVEKVQKLYKSGVTEFEDIYKKVSMDIPKNESFFGALSIFIVFLIFAIIGLVAFFGGNAKWPVIILAVLSLGISICAYCDMQSEYRDIQKYIEIKKKINQLEQKTIKVNFMTVKLDNEIKNYVILTDQNGIKDTITMEDFLDK
jgi:uncharacterized integral membrane protein